MNSQTLKGKNILITGASSGIGRACAINCNAEGANVHLLGRHIDRLEAVSQLLTTKKFSLNELDVTESEKIEPVIKRIVEQYGKFDGFIHSAGVQHMLPFRSQSNDHFKDVFSINTISAFDISRILVKKSYANREGMSLVFISSVMSVVAEPGLTSYCASKAALVGGAKAMAMELAAYKIRVNCVSPGTIEDTEMTNKVRENLDENDFQFIVDKHPLGLGSSQGIATLCAYLLSDSASWITGQNIVIDGGYSIQ